MYSKDSYNYGRHGRKRRLKPISFIITVLVIILILGGLYFLLFNGKNKYEDYTTYNTNNKQYGTVKHYEKDNDQFYVSLYYPKVKEKNLNKIIKESYKIPCFQSMFKFSDYQQIVVKGAFPMLPLTAYALLNISYIFKIRKKEERSKRYTLFRLFM